MGPDTDNRGSFILNFWRTGLHCQTLPNGSPGQNEWAVFIHFGLCSFCTQFHFHPFSHWHPMLQGTAKDSVTSQLVSICGRRLLYSPLLELTLLTEIWHTPAWKCIHVNSQLGITAAKHKWLSWNKANSSHINNPLDRAATWCCLFREVPSFHQLLPVQEQLNKVCVTLFSLTRQNTLFWLLTQGCFSLYSSS